MATMKKTNPKVSAQQEKDSVPVRGIFKNFETPGGTLSFSAKPFAGQKVQKYTLVDGMTYTLPKGIARRLARECCYPVHAYAQDEKGMPVQGIGKMIYRFGFQSLEFMGDESFEKPLIEQPVMLPLII